jgi:3-hydroxymyristoyl/3-hydroxydecanoyl-(acyl carrier protein) dehydratase
MMRITPMPSEGGHRFAVEIPAESPLFAGHFPGHPILPGIAHLALAERALRAIAGGDASLAGVRSLKLRRPVAPGDALELRIGDLEDGIARFELRRGGEAASQGVVQFRTGPWEKTEDAAAIAVTAGSGAGFPPPESLLPHARPALLLRAVVEASEGTIACLAEVPPDHPLVVAGRFPAFLALEAAAQAAAALEALGRREAPGPRIGYLVGIRDARFLAPSLPAGRPLRVSARLEGGAFPLSVYSAALGELAVGTISTFLLAEP